MVQPGIATFTVEPAQGSTLRPVGQPRGATQVQLAGGVQHDTVTHDNRVKVGVTGKIGEHTGGDLDGDRPLRDWAGPIGGGVGVGVDDHHELGTPCPPDTRSALDQRHQGMPGKEPLLLERIIRAPLGNRLSKHRLDRRLQFRGESHPGDRIEQSAQVPHPVGVDPCGHSNIASLTGEAVDAVVGLDTFHLDGHSTGELLGC